MPLPCKTLPAKAAGHLSIVRLTVNRAMAEAAMPDRRDSNTVGQWYHTVTGNWNASMAV